MVFMIKHCSQGNCGFQEEFTLLSCYSFQRLNVQADTSMAGDLKRLTRNYSGEAAYDRPIIVNSILNNHTLLFCASCSCHFCASGPNCKI